MTAKSQKLKAYNRQVAALKLRLIGLTYEEIARRVGYSNAGAANKAVKAALTETKREDANELRIAESERLDALQAALMPKALKGDVSASQAILRLMERRSRLFGLDMPVKQTIAHAGHIDVKNLSDEELFAIIASESGSGDSAPTGNSD